jgi:hypothetical protein
VRHDLKKVKPKPPVNVGGRRGAKGPPFASLPSQWIRLTLYGTGCCYQRTTKNGKMDKTNETVSIPCFRRDSTRWLFDLFFSFDSGTSESTLSRIFYSWLSKCYYTVSEIFGDFTEISVIFGDFTELYRKFGDFTENSEILQKIRRFYRNFGDFRRFYRNFGEIRWLFPRFSKRTLHP